jgi:hypothetical protein
VVEIPGSNLGEAATLTQWLPSVRDGALATKNSVKLTGTELKPVVDYCEHGNTFGFYRPNSWITH